MPMLQTMASRLNSLFGVPAITGISPDLFAPGRSLADAANALAVDDGLAGAGAYIAQLPASMQEAIRAAVYENLLRITPLAVTWAWAPAYDYELSIWEAPGTAVSPGGITIFVRSRYPADRLPG